MDHFLVRRVTEGQTATIEGQGQASHKSTPSKDGGKQSQKKKKKIQWGIHQIRIYSDHRQSRRRGTTVFRVFNITVKWSRQNYCGIWRCITFSWMPSLLSTCNRCCVIFVWLKFWISCQTEFPELAAKAMRCLLPFQIPVWERFFYTGVLEE